jgi:hypothetical protein
MPRDKRSGGPPGPPPLADSAAAKQAEVTISVARGPRRHISEASLRRALHSAAGLPPHLVPALLVVAAHADGRGRGARVSSTTVGRCTGKSMRQAQRDLAALEDLGLLRRGDPRYAPGRPGMGGPAVYELPMARSAR